MHYFKSPKIEADGAEPEVAQPQASPESADMGDISELEVAKPQATPKKEAKPKNLVQMFGAVGPSEGTPFRHRAPSAVPFKSPVGRPEIQRAKEQVKREEGLEAAASALPQAPQVCKTVADGIRGRANTNQPGRPKAAPRTGKAAGFKSNKRQLGSPVLRRDPSAQEKLRMIGWVEGKCKLAFDCKPKSLASSTRRSFEARSFGAKLGQLINKLFNPLINELSNSLIN